MKFLVLSDSHGSMEEIDIVLHRHKDVDVIFHCGDVEFPKEDIDKRNIICVNGNSVYDTEFEDELILTIKNKKFLITHGHLYDVKSGTDLLKKKAQKLKIDYCLFGHTHVIHYENVDGILIINPGSINKPNNTVYEKSYFLHDNGVSRFYNIKGDIMYEFNN